MAEVLTIEHLAIPGLHKPPTIKDLQESSREYNQLPDDSDQPEVLQLHLDILAEIFVRHNAQNKFGLHLIHGHGVQQGKVKVGINFTDPLGYWTVPMEISQIDLNNIHGHIFKLTPRGSLVAYEFREGSLEDVTGIEAAFFQDLIDYLRQHNLASVLGLQALCGESSQEMVEFVLDNGNTVMLDKSIARYGGIYRVTGWYISLEDGIVTCNGGEAHAETTKGTHQVFVGSKPLPDLKAMKALLEVEGIIGT